MGARQYHPLQQILVVDSDLSLSQSVRKRLVAPSRRIQCVPTAFAARHLSNCYEVGVFHTDLPDGCGIELARELIRSGTICSAVFLARALDAERAREARQLGECVSVASGVEAIAAAVRRQLRERRAEDEADKVPPPSSGRRRTPRG